VDTNLLDCVEMAPGGEVGRAVIWLHGLGADGHDFEPLVPYLGIDPRLAVRFVFPHAPRRPVTINMGLIMPAWYDIRDLSLRRDVDEKGVLESADQLRALVARERERGVPADRIVLAGFSQGGAIALHVGLRYEESLAGILALSSYLVCDQSIEGERSEANRDVPIFQAHGSLDPMVPPQAGELARDRLVELGYSPQWKTYPMGHEVHPDEIRDVGAWLNGVLSAGA
jgi:phospholipase/carboxylesterase